MMKYYVGGFAAFIIIVGGGYYFLNHNQAAPAPQQGQPSAPTAIATSTYATSTFSVVYPSDYTVDDTYQNTEVSPKKPISGVKFTIPSTMATGTNLASDSYISVEWLPRANLCTGDIYLAANVKSEMITDNGVEYSVASSSQGAAGNFYDETVYAFPNSKPCIAVRYFIHSTDIDNYPAGTVQQFDENALMSAFDAIRDSVVLTQPVMAPTQ